MKFLALSLFTIQVKKSLHFLTSEVVVVVVILFSHDKASIWIFVAKHLIISR